MKVLKFGGTSVGSKESILSLKHIVEEQPEKVIVVVSALGGITDQLINTSKMALKGDEEYRKQFEQIVERHHKMVNDVITDEEKRNKLMPLLNSLLDELKSIYYGVYLIGDLSEKTQAAIVSYGERLSSHIVATLIDGAVRVDARQMIKTEEKHGKHVLDSELSTRLVRSTIQLPLQQTIIVPGFISADKDSDETTNLGRGGSDYTASIIAAALNAEVLEIWTDVDGFMTADPRVIHSA